MISLIKFLQKKVSGFFEIIYEKNNEKRKSKFKIHSKINTPGIILIIYIITNMANC